MCGARARPGRQPKGADAGLGSRVCLLTSPKRSPALSLPPGAAGPPGPGCGLCRPVERRGTPKVACRPGLGLGRSARSSGAAAAGGEVWGPHEGAPVLRRPGREGGGPSRSRGLGGGSVGRRPGALRARGATAPPGSEGGASRGRSASPGGRRWAAASGCRASAPWPSCRCSAARTVDWFYSPGIKPALPSSRRQPHVGGRPSPAPCASPPRVQRRCPAPGPGERRVPSRTCPLQTWVPRTRGLKSVLGAGGGEAPAGNWPSGPGRRRRRQRAPGSVPIELRPGRKGVWPLTRIWRSSHGHGWHQEGPALGRAALNRKCAGRLGRVESR